MLTYTSPLQLKLCTCMTLKFRQRLNALDNVHKDSLSDMYWLITTTIVVVIRNETNSQSLAKIYATGKNSGPFTLVTGRCGQTNVYSAIQLLGDRWYMALECL